MSNHSVLQVVVILAGRKLLWRLFLVVCASIVRVIMAAAETLAQEDKSLDTLVVVIVVVVGRRSK